MRTGGRAGFVARGVVYILVGVLALAIAFGRSAGQADRQGALRQIAAQPYGPAMLWALAVGFAGMTLWRASLAVLGENGRRKTGSRLLNAARACFYASVCWGTAVYAAGSGGGSNSDASSQDWTASALRMPGGRFLVGLAGLALAAAGIGIAVRAFQRRFLRKLQTGAMGRRTRQVVTALGLGGNVARGAVFLGAGVFVLTAAVTFDPHQAKGMDAVLRSFASTPAGPWLLVLVAAGLVLFGGFSFASARWRRF
ncbi:DUF1206 domain-containing protein [Streptacidiphilus rugosus]|uniref:DUF1206 domain-containing protein n=1 Tax=Streptacidiphilus rugosus TaxID=405783 RepID=UPI00055F9102|nr:DUF1206 domain-containing protein [Streptacidiphilus rugosus]